MWGYPRSLTSSDLMELNDSVHCANSTLATDLTMLKYHDQIPWSNTMLKYHAQIPWSNTMLRGLTGPVNFILPKVAQGLPHKVLKNPAALRASFFRYLRKASGEVAPTPSPCPGEA